VDLNVKIQDKEEIMNAIYQLTNVLIEMNLQLSALSDTVAMINVNNLEMAENGRKEESK